MAKYNYKNPNYTKVEGLTNEDITKLLKEVYEGYEEYHDEPFLIMVKLFAKDDYFKYHYIAKEYLENNPE